MEEGLRIGEGYMWMGGGLHDWEGAVYGCV